MILLIFATSFDGSWGSRGWCSTTGCMAAIAEKLERFQNSQCFVTIVMNEKFGRTKERLDELMLYGTWIGVSSISQVA